MATITLGYEVNVGLQKASNKVSRIDSVNIIRGELDMIGATLVSRNTVVTGGNTLRHEVVVQTTSQGDVNFPTDADKISVTRNLYTGALTLLIPAKVTAEEPVVS